MSKIFTILLVITAPFFCRADILKISKISEMEKIISTCNENSLIIFDNDNVISIPKDTILEPPHA